MHALDTSWLALLPHTSGTKSYCFEQTGGRSYFQRCAALDSSSAPVGGPWPIQFDGPLAQSNYFFCGVKSVTNAMLASWTDGEYSYMLPSGCANTKGCSSTKGCSACPQGRTLYQACSASTMCLSCQVCAAL